MALSKYRKVVVVEKDGNNQHVLKKNVVIKIIKIFFFINVYDKNFVRVILPHLLNVAACI